MSGEFVGAFAVDFDGAKARGSLGDFTDEMMDDKLNIIPFRTRSFAPVVTGLSRSVARRSSQRVLNETILSLSYIFRYLSLRVAGGGGVAEFQGGFVDFVFF